MEISQKKSIHFMKKGDDLQKGEPIAIEKQTLHLAKETPVALVYNGISHAVFMVTPCDLEEFAVGFSLTEGIIQHPQQIYGIDIIENLQGIEVQIELATRCFVELKHKRRNLVGRTGCGICGMEQLEQIKKNFAILDRTFQFDYQKLDACLTSFNQAQQLGHLTGATHAVAYFSLEGKLLAMREDIGRHVALDKLLGWYVQSTPEAGFILASSRASYEMVQKVLSAKIEMLVAMSAATELAVDIAEQHQLTLLGFARMGRATIYTGAERIV